MAGRVWPARDAWLTRIHLSLFLELANMYDMLPYLTASFPILSSVWDYVPHGLTCRVTWQRTGGPRRRRTGRAKWQGGHAATWARVWGDTCGRLCREKGKAYEGNSFPYLIAPSSATFSVWDYVPTRFFCFAGRVAARGSSDSGSTAVIAWTRVHAITIKARA